MPSALGFGTGGTAQALQQLKALQEQRLAREQAEKAAEKQRLLQIAGLVLQGTGQVNQLNQTALGAIFAPSGNTGTRFTSAGGGGGASIGGSSASVGPTIDLGSTLGGIGGL